MPVARIVTRFAEEAAPLIARLRARGYTIEIVDPGTFRVTPAELEIELDRLSTPEALSRAARFARERDAEVFVAAGLPLDEEAARALRGAVVRRNVVAEGFKKLIAPFRRLGAEAHEDRKARRQRQLDLELTREAEKKAKAEQRSAEKEERQRLEEQARAERARREQEEAERRRVEREAALAGQREEEERQRVAREAAMARQREADERTRVEREAALARQREEEARLEAEREAQAAARQRQEAVERQRREADAARRATEEAERRRVAEEVAAAERERQQEEERQRAIAGAAALVEARKRDAEQVRARQRQAAISAGRPALQVSPNHRAMKRGLVAAACVAVLMTIGWSAYENRTPAQPLTNQQRVQGGQIQQDVPFGAASIQPQPQQKPATAKPQSPQQKKTAQQKPAPAAAPKTSPKRERRYANDDVDMVAEDEIVYHGAPKNSKSRASAQPQQKDGVKKISDLDGEDQ